MRRRMGWPGLAGTMARTAVIAGTATAVSGAVSGSMKTQGLLSDEEFTAMNTKLMGA